MDGQVYVTVEADEATPMVLDASGSGGGGETTFGITVLWTFSGGITGTGNWMGATPVEGNVEATNESVRQAWIDKTLADAMQVPGCITFTSH